MSTVEKIEYYSTCPSCGAPSDPSGTCPYCGSSLVKNRVVTELDASEEDAILQEDMSLPIVKGKCGKVDSFFKIFCPLFGGIFVLVPTILCVAFSVVRFLNAFMFLFCLPFFAIGLGALIPLFVAMSNEKKCLEGQRLVGIVRGYENSSVSVNGSPVKIIRVRVDEGGSRLIVFSTGNAQRTYPIGSKIVLRNSGEHYLIEGSAE